MRDGCYECVLKHLGQAYVLSQECFLGYPGYAGYVIGHMAEASDESVSKNMNLAMLIREHRIKWTESHAHKIPFESLFSYLECCIACEKSNAEIPSVPEGCLEGLDADSDGMPVFSGDTRPVSGLKKEGDDEKKERYPADRDVGG